MRLREYSAPLTVFAAGLLGFSLICIVSAAALTNPATPNASELEAQNIVDSAFSNPISTVVALTAVEISEYIPTPTLSLEELITPSPTLEASATSTRRPFVTWTPIPPTRTRSGRFSTATFTLIPSITPSRTPTRTLTPSLTNTLPPPTLTPTDEPTKTYTPEPPTPTLTPSNTPVPPTVTDTSAPPPTFTFTPEPTIPAATPTAGSLVDPTTQP